MLFELHDWEIACISSNRSNKVIKICLKMPQTSEEKILRLINVSHFYLNEMTIQNVILDVILFDKQHKNEDYFSHVCSVLKIKPTFFLEHPDSKIIYFEPSIGAELACCFSDYSFQ